MATKKKTTKPVKKPKKLTTQSDPPIETPPKPPVNP